MTSKRPCSMPWTADRTRHEYRLTPAGAAAVPVVHALARWGEAYTTAIDEDAADRQAGPAARPPPSPCGL
jgi:hypothetical protein